MQINESALLAHRTPGIVGGTQISHSGVLPARFATALGFWRPRRRRT
jgi:hypothetical protein